MRFRMRLARYAAGTVPTPDNMVRYARYKVNSDLGDSSDGTSHQTREEEGKSQRANMSPGKT